MEGEYVSAMNGIVFALAYLAYLNPPSKEMIELTDPLLPLNCHHGYLLERGHDFEECNLATVVFEGYIAIPYTVQLY